MQTVLSDATMRWAEKEIGRRLTAPTADTSKARKELVKVERELHNVADAIARIGVGSLSVRATAGEVRTARNALQGILGIVRVDRRGKGYADLSTGVPTRMVAGACYAMSRDVVPNTAQIDRPFLERTRPAWPKKTRL